MMSSPRCLSFGVPAPFEFEAPSSWLTRLAFAQGLGSMGELLRFLDLPAGDDLDWHLQGRPLQVLLERCNLPSQSFAIAAHVMRGARASGIGVRRLLLGKDNSSRFRYCPCCLADRRVAHLDIHWRFKCWRMCPVHNCVMMDTCPNCPCVLEHPCLLDATHAGRSGHSTLGRCPKCCTLLSGPEVRRLAAEYTQILSKQDMLYAENGRAVLSALCARHFEFRGQLSSLQRLKDRYADFIGLPMNAIDRKMEAWRVICEFLREHPL